MGIDVDPHNALNKLAFGPGPGDLQKVGKSGFTPWLAEQLRPPAEDDCADRIAAMRWHVKYTSKNPDAEVDEERPIAVINGGIDQHWKILDKTVLPGFVKRCGARCGEVFNQVIAPIAGVRFGG